VTVSTGWNSSSSGVANHAARVAGCERTFRHVARDDAAGADHRPRADAHTGQDQRAAADPDVGTDLDRLAEFLITGGVVACAVGLDGIPVLWREACEPLQQQIA
jgi:hypothetical protein